MVRIIDSFFPCSCRAYEVLAYLVGGLFEGSCSGLAWEMQRSNSCANHTPYGSGLFWTGMGNAGSKCHANLLDVHAILSMVGMGNAGSKCHARYVKSGTIQGMVGMGTATAIQGMVGTILVCHMAYGWHGNCW